MPPPASSAASPAGAARPTAETLATLVALTVAFFWAVDGIDFNAPQLERFAIFVTTIVLAGIAMHGASSAAAWTSYLAVLVSISERMRRTPFDGSDVLRATSESLGIVASGGNPYDSFLLSTIPPGSPFVYPPGELAWYAIPQWLFGDITRVDTWAGVLVVVAIVLAGFAVGFEAVALPAMLYAAWGIAAFRGVDGSNDVSASALVVFACVALAFAAGEGPWPRRAFVASAALFGWAIAFKQFTVLVLPPVARHLAVSGAPWRRYVAIALGVAAAFVLPFFVRDPVAFIATEMQTLTFHQEVWGGNVLNALSPYHDPRDLLGLFGAIEIAGTVALTILVATRWNAPTLGLATLAGAGLVLVPLLTAKWTTQPYYIYVGALAACGLALARTRVGGHDPG